MLNVSVPFPVYAARQTAELAHIYDRLKSAAQSAAGSSAVLSLLASKHMASVTEPDAAALPEPSVKTLQALLPGSGEAWKLPTLAMVANYDTFGVFPDLSSGATKASGAVTLLAAARLLGKLYSSPLSRPKSNVLLLLTGGSAQNYEGARAWLESADRRLVDGIEYVLGLDSLSQPGPLSLHSARLPKDGNNASRLLAELQRGDGQVSFVHKKISRSSDARSWEHEHFGARMLAAGTLTTRASPGPLVATFEPTSLAAAELVAQRAWLVAEAVARLAFNATAQELDLELVSRPSKADVAFAEEWLELVGSAGHVTQNASSVASVLAAFQTVLRKYPYDIAVKETRLSSKAWTLYGPTTAVMKVDVVLGSLFDGLCLPLVGLYLALLYLAVGKFSALSDSKVKRS